MLAFRDVVRQYGSTRALDKVSFALEPGKLTVVTGANGAGKSTLLRLAALLESPSSGDITGVARSDLAWLGQEPGLYDHLSVGENLRFAARFFGREGEVEAAASAFGIEGKLQTRALRLSRGERQRAALARALLCGPLLVLDEPTTALDADGAASCIALLESLRGKRTLLIATHEPELVKRADRVLALHGGKLA